ncbi:hypothetical protein SKAU_G00336370 [Synaphobranchus kaupii]|uniref:Uncharacterized protein n=1 Tax=Synaphobranchus kaupii TaxID=118154 RepID=A0A9Q1EM86_SYNKA|nr:hypothetical protein SKAU_G00336370 [Synaphobranchus kaupii]
MREECPGSGLDRTAVVWHICPSNKRPQQLIGVIHPNNCSALVTASTNQTPYYYTSRETPTHLAVDFLTFQSRVHWPLEKRGNIVLCGGDPNSCRWDVEVKPDLTGRSRPIPIELVYTDTAHSPSPSHTHERPMAFSVSIHLLGGQRAATAHPHLSSQAFQVLRDCSSKQGEEKEPSEIAHRQHATVKSSILLFCVLPAAVSMATITWLAAPRLSQLDGWKRQAALHNRSQPMGLLTCVRESSSALAWALRSASCGNQATLHQAMAAVPSRPPPHNSTASLPLRRE